MPPPPGQGPPSQSSTSSSLLEIEVDFGADLESAIRIGDFRDPIREITSEAAMAQWLK
ncbi:hypothetical protein HDU99_007840, partial [Rhizoclosmatium hyalinum]